MTLIRNIIRAVLLIVLISALFDKTVGADFVIFWSWASVIIIMWIFNEMSKEYPKRRFEYKILEFGIMAVVFICAAIMGDAMCSYFPITTFFSFLATICFLTSIKMAARMWYQNEKAKMVTGYLEVNNGER